LEALVTWAPHSTATIADLASIELRRIVDVLQVEHASVFLHDPDDPRGATQTASTGLAVEAVLAEHRDVVARVMRTGRVHEVEHPLDRGRSGCSAIAVPLLEDRRAVGVLLVVTVRESRRLGAFDAKTIARAAETLVSRIVAPHGRRTFDRFTRP
jgi:hypothetical protein